MRKRQDLRQIIFQLLNAELHFRDVRNLIILINALEVSADAIFCDVLDYAAKFKESQLAEELDTLSPDAKKRILQIVEFMIWQEKNSKQ